MYANFLHFSHALGREVEFVILSEQIPLARASSAIDALRDAQKMCAVTKVGTVLNSYLLPDCSSECLDLNLRYFRPAEVITDLQIGV